MAAGVNEATKIYNIIERFRQDDWTKFAKTHLQLRDNDIEQDELRYPRDPREQRYQMVLTWQRRTGKGATVSKLEELKNKFHHMHLLPPERQHVVTTPEDDSPNNAGFNFSQQSQPTAAPVQTAATVRTAAPVQSGSTPFQHSSYTQHAAESQNQMVAVPATVTKEPVVPVAQSVNGNSGARPKAFGGSAMGKDKNKTSESPILEKKGQMAEIGSLHGTQEVVVGDGVLKVSSWNKLKNFFRPKKTKDTYSPSNYCQKVSKIKVKEMIASKHKEKRKQNDVYVTDKKYKGKVLILNNTFEGQDNVRHGAKLDGENMEKLWEEYGCHVFLERDQTARQMKEGLKSMALTSKGQYNFIVVVVMSHGGLKMIQKTSGNKIVEESREVVYGNDNELIPVSDILHMFSNKEAEYLQGIPKFFIFQFCRGSTTDEGVVRKDSLSQTDDFDENLRQMMKQVTSSIVADSIDERYPTVSDIIVAYSTHPQNTALRNIYTGSWFINAITNVFMEYSKDEHVVELLTKVNNAMKEKNGFPDGKPGKAMSHFDSSLSKKFYLFPGHPK